MNGQELQAFENHLNNRKTGYFFKQETPDSFFIGKIGCWMERMKFKIWRQQPKILGRARYEWQRKERFLHRWKLDTGPLIATGCQMSLSVWLPGTSQWAASPSLLDAARKIWKEKSALLNLRQWTFEIQNIRETKHTKQQKGLTSNQFPGTLGLAGLQAT